MMRRTLPILAAALLCGAWGCQSPTPAATGQPHECREIAPRTFNVLRVVDGETFNREYFSVPLIRCFAENSSLGPLFAKESGPEVG